MTRKPSPYRVNCIGEPGIPGCGSVFLTEAEYYAQMNCPDATWRCPICRREALWDDENYEKFYEGSGSDHDDEA